MLENLIKMGVDSFALVSCMLLLRLLSFRLDMRYT